MITETKLPLNSSAEKVADELLTAFGLPRNIKPIRIDYTKRVDQVGPLEKHKLLIETIKEIVSISSPIFFRSPLFGRMKAILVNIDLVITYYKVGTDHTKKIIATTDEHRHTFPHIAIGPKPLKEYVAQKVLEEHFEETPYYYRDLKLYKLKNLSNVTISFTVLATNLFTAIDLF